MAVRATSQEAKQSEKDTCAEKGDDKVPDKAGATQMKQTHQEATNEGTNEANYDITDDPIAATATHHRARQCPSDQTDE
jgi:hypothetical protein